MATINVPADQSTIQAGINAAAAGDTVLVAAGTYIGGVNLNKAVILRTTADAVIQASSDGNGTGIEISASGCEVDGFTIRNFGEGIAVDAGDTVGYNDVTIRNFLIENVQYGLWITGLRWTVRDGEIDRVRRWYSGDIDYARVFGRNHYFFNLYWHGVNLPSDLAPLSGTDYGHTDCFQFYNQNPNNQRILIDCVWEECCFGDFVQGAFVANEFVAPNCIQNLTFRNCVFWGRAFTPAGNLIGSASHGIFLGKEDAITGVVIENCFFRYCANVWTLDGIPGSTITIRRCVYDGVDGEGTVYSFQSGTPKSVLSVGTGNWLQDYSWFGANGGFAADITGQEGGYGDTLIGVSGDWRGSDAGWRPTNPAALLYGPQIGVTPPVEPPVEVGLWQEKWRADTRVWGSDGTISCRVSATRVVWFMGHPILTEVGNNTRTFPPAVIINNGVAIQDNNGDLQWRYGAGDTNFFPTPATVPGATFFHPAYAEIGADGNLYVYGWGVTTGGIFGGGVRGTCRFRITNPTADPAVWSMTEQAWSNFEYGAPEQRHFVTAMAEASATAANPAARPSGPGSPGNTTPGGTAQTTGGNPTVTPVGTGSIPAYKYIFGFNEDNEAILARVTQADYDANDQADWEYWTGAAWSADILEAGALWTGDSSNAEFDVFYDVQTRMYYVFYVSDIFGTGTVLCRRASAPQGPWSNAVQVYTPEIVADDADYVGYAPRIHDEISDQPDVEGLLLSVNTNSTDVADLAADDLIYFPEFADVPRNLNLLFD